LLGLHMATKVRTMVGLLDILQLTCGSNWAPGQPHQTVGVEAFG
jgi:hypothetical protein